MPHVHAVAQGEHIATIAAAYGFGSYEPIWNHARNAELKKLRSDPFVLFPGDQLFIPDPQAKSFSAATGQRHQVVVKAGKVKVRVQLHDSLGSPLANEPCKLAIGPAEQALQTDGDGFVEFAVRPTDRKAELTAGELIFPLEIGHLDPPDTASGVAARLGNLGHAYASPVELELRDEARYFALSLFLEEEKLDPKSQPLDVFVKHLRSKHGV